MKYVKLLVILAIVFFMMPNSNSQYDIHMIIGYVYANGNTVPKINLTIINEDTMDKLYKMTDKYGFFSFNTGSFRGPGWKDGQKIKIIAYGKGAYEGWRGEGEITIDYDFYYQWINITLHPSIYVNFSYVPAEPTDLQEVKFFDLSAGNIVNYTWIFGDGSIAYEKNPEHRYADDGVYNVTLTVRDENGNEASKSRQIRIVNVPPVAILYYNIMENMVEGNASKSYDPDGEIVGYEWKWDGGNWYKGGKIEKQYLKGGEHTIYLRIIDDDGAETSIEVPIFISESEIKSPIANFTYTPQNPTTVDKILFNSTSTDDGNIVNYTWIFGDGSIAYEKNPEHVYGREGKYNVTLIVRDDEGGIGKITKEISISNSPPSADFSYTIKNRKIIFMDKSTDDGNIVNYTWIFGDGSIAYEKNPEHVYGREGKYNVTLIVRDDEGGIGKITKEISIERKEIPSFYTILSILSLLFAMVARKFKKI